MLSWLLLYKNVNQLSVQSSSVAQSCPTPWDPMDCSTPGFPVHHQLPELAQTHVHWVGDAIPTISSSVIPFSSCLPPFPASGSFPMSQFFASGGQSIGVSASASVLPMNIQDWFPFGWTGWISLQSKGFSRVFSTPQFKRISNKYTYIPSLLNLPPHTPIPTHPHRAPSWAPCATQQLPTSYLLYTWQCIYVNLTLPPPLTSYFPFCVHMSIFYICVSIPGMQTDSSEHLYHLSRFYMLLLLFSS